MDKWHDAKSVAFVVVVGLFGDGNLHTIRQAVPSFFHPTGTLTMYTTPRNHTHQKSNNMHEKLWKIIYDLCESHFKTQLAFKKSSCQV